MTESNQQESPTLHPLYQQVRRMLVDRLASGDWSPGELLPSETALAQFYGVSQGTIRKALDTMAADRLVVRHQGRGTEVAKHDSERSLFQFWHLYGEDSTRQIPSSKILKCTRTTARAGEARLLNIKRGAPVIRIGRCRYINDQPLIIEWITLPAERFPGIESYGKDLPNTLYSLYQKHYRVTIQTAVEKLRAVKADRPDAEPLGIKAGAPLLEIERVAFDLEDEPVELRMSRCDTQSLHYRNVLD
jgi:GntR family transcriptional regulator